MERAHIGQILVEKKFMRPEQLQLAIMAQKKLNASSARKFRLGEVCLFQKMISLSQLHEALRTQGQAAPTKAKRTTGIYWITHGRLRNDRNPT